MKHARHVHRVSMFSCPGPRSWFFHHPHLLPAPGLRVCNSNMETSIYYSRSEYIETVCYSRISAHFSLIACTGYWQQSLSTSYNCWTAKHHPWRQDHHSRWSNHQRRPEAYWSRPYRCNPAWSILSHRRGLHYAVSPMACTR
jgi:hypothetical protein